jgi:hypothetical protein
LPEFPQPTHDYPEAKDHVIKYHDGEQQVRINPIRGTKGIARHPVVTIWDAIGDLPQFDWFVIRYVKKKKVFSKQKKTHQQGTSKSEIREPCKEGRKKKASGDDTFREMQENRALLRLYRQHWISSRTEDVLSISGAFGSDC